MKNLQEIGVNPNQGKHHEEIVYSTVLLSNVITNQITEYLKPFGLTPGKFNIMMVVKHHGKDKGIIQVEVSKRLIVTPSNMTKMIDKLEKEGMVERFAREGDKRINVLKITSKGSKLLDEVWEGYNKSLSLLSVNITKEKQKMLSALLQEWLEGVR